MNIISAKLNGDFSVKITYEGGQEWAVPMNPDNTDYQAYLKWLEEGNTPEPADTQGAA